MFITPEYDRMEIIADDQEDEKILDRMFSSAITFYRSYDCGKSGRDMGIIIHQRNDLK
jgi:hypothetical protein